MSPPQSTQRKLVDFFLDTALFDLLAYFLLKKISKEGIYSKREILAANTDDVSNTVAVAAASEALWKENYKKENFQNMIWLI